MTNPKVSIIIPVYNGSNYVGEAIESALKQTYENIEIVVINDGSNDNNTTEKIALSYGKKIKYFSKENGGVSTALNLGIEKMTGEYFSWLSHDDLYYPYKIEEQINFIKSIGDKDTVVFCNSEFIKPNGDFLYGSSIGNIPSHRVLYKALIGYPINGCGLLIKKEFFNEVGNFNETLRNMQDYDMWFRLLRKYKFVMLNKVLVQNRRHPEQDSNTRTLNGLKDELKLNKKVLTMFTTDELRISAGSKLPNIFFSIYLNFRLYLLQFLGYSSIITRKLGIHTFLTPIVRKIFF